MKRENHDRRGLIADAAFIAAISLVNRCLQSEKSRRINRDQDEKSLSRKLTVVSLVYHVIGILYND